MFQACIHPQVGVHGINNHGSGRRTKRRVFGRRRKVKRGATSIMASGLSVSGNGVDGERQYSNFGHLGTRHEARDNLNSMELDSDSSYTGSDGEEDDTSAGYRK